MQIQSCSLLLSLLLSFKCYFYFAKLQSHLIIRDTLYTKELGHIQMYSSLNQDCYWHLWKENNTLSIFLNFCNSQTNVKYYFSQNFSMSSFEFILCQLWFPSMISYHIPLFFFCFPALFSICCWLHYIQKHLIFKLIKNKMLFKENHLLHLAFSTIIA